MGKEFGGGLTIVTPNRRPARVTWKFQEGDWGLGTLYHTASSRYAGSAVTLEGQATGPLCHRGSVLQGSL